jgi:hypothetical protein
MDEGRLLPRKRAAASTRASRGAALDGYSEVRDDWGQGVAESVQTRHDCGQWQYPEAALAKLSVIPGSQAKARLSYPKSFPKVRRRRDCEVIGFSGLGIARGSFAEPRRSRCSI